MGFARAMLVLKSKFGFDAQGLSIIALKNNQGFVIEGNANGRVAFNALVLSRAGVDLFNITDSISDVQKLADVALAEESVKRCFYGPMTQWDNGTAQLSKETELFASASPEIP